MNREQSHGAVDGQQYMGWLNAPGCRPLRWKPLFSCPALTNRLTLNELETSAHCPGPHLRMPGNVSVRDGIDNAFTQALAQPVKMLGAFVHLLAGNFSGFAETDNPRDVFGTGPES